MAKAFFVDLTRCTGCRGCQIACKQWKNLPAEETTNRGGHTNPPDLSSVTYKTVRTCAKWAGKDFRMLFFLNNAAIANWPVHDRFDHRRRHRAGRRRARCCSRP